MITAQTAKRRSAGVRDGQSVKSQAAERAKKEADEVRAKELAGYMIDHLERKIEEAIVSGGNQASEYRDESDRGVMSWAFYKYIGPHFKRLGYTLHWEYNDDHGIDESGRVTFEVTVMWAE